MIRELHCPFASAINPLEGEVQATMLRWARQIEALPTEREYKRLAAFKVNRLASRFFPEAHRGPLQLATDWLGLFCLIDDASEDASMTSMDTAAMLGKWLDVLRHGTRREGEGGIARALRDLRTRMLDETPTEWFERFLARVSDTFAGFTWEAINRAYHLAPGRDAYRNARRLTVGLYPLIEFVELAGGFTVPRELRALPVVMELEGLTCLAVGLENDLFTCEREIEEGELHNMVIVTMREQNVGLPEAVQRVITMHDDVVARFVDLSTSLPSVGAGEASLHQFVSGLRYLIRGHLDWAHETGRYQPIPMSM